MPQTDVRVFACAKAPSKLQMLLMPYPESHMRGHDSCNDVFETLVQMRKDSEARLIFAEHQSLTWNMLFSSTFSQMSLKSFRLYALRTSPRLTIHFQPLLSLPLPTVISLPPGSPTTFHLALQDQHPIACSQPSHTASPLSALSSDQRWW